MALNDPNLGLAYGWAQGEHNWNGGMDANLKRLGAVVGLSVKDRDLATPTRDTRGRRSLHRPGNRHRHLGGSHRPDRGAHRRCVGVPRPQDRLDLLRRGRGRALRLQSDRLEPRHRRLIAFSLLHPPNPPPGGFFVSGDQQ